MPDDLGLVEVAHKRRLLTDAAVAQALTMYTPEPNTGCWLWEGRYTPDGYGVTGAAFRAHRVVYEALGGHIPDGLQLDHKCRVRCCVNPDHLEPVTLRENVIRGYGRTAINLRKTHCLKGHPFDEENTIYRHRDGHLERTCRACQNARNVVRTIKRSAQRQARREQKNG